MSDGMLYHAFGIRGYEIVRQEKFDRRCLSFSLRATPPEPRCVPLDPGAVALCSLRTGLLVQKSTAGPETVQQ